MGPTIVLRPVGPGDGSALAAILNAEILDGTASWKVQALSVSDIADRVSRCADAGHGFIVAGDGDEILGFASYGPFRSGEGYARTVENSVYVARTARRRGIARRLMTALIDHAKAAGLSRMVAGISADQAGSLALHRALGFTPCGLLPGVGHKLGQSLDLALLVLAMDGDSLTRR